MSATLISRLPIADDAILGVSPSRVFEPRTVQELAEVIRGTAAERSTLAPIGSGTQLDLGNALLRYDAAIRTRALNRIIEYAPEDQIVVVEAGITLVELQTELAKSGQRLTVDATGSERMTIGGLLATNAYGPSAARYGMLKDLIVGIEIVRADGVIARGGGKVVKNVAGFDLSKLMVGSLGTLAIVSKASFRVHPIPELRRAVTLRLPSAEVFAFVLALREAQTEPSAIAAELDSAGARVHVRYEGFGAGVEAQIDACRRLAGTFGAEPYIDDAQPVDEDDGAVWFRATFPPADFARVAAALALEGLRTRAFPATGSAWCQSAPSLGPDVVTSLRSFFESLGGKLVVHRMPAAWRESVDAWGAPPPSFALMQSLKQRFDPNRRLNPGRFVGGL
ncbi:MAG: FAD-binding oxidoreductase [Vulcanimicrobiaceae bacterium]